MAKLRKTPLYDRHIALGAKIIGFGGWDMPLQYSEGIVAEHLATRKSAGLFDVSHMGRFIFRGMGALAFLQHSLTNNAAALDVGMAQYTIIQNEYGGAVDDAYLYRFVKDEYLLVVNAANKQKDWDHFQSLLSGFSEVKLTDASDEIAMISLQGPLSKKILSAAIDRGDLPEARRNYLSSGIVKGAEAKIARTGYTGEPLCFELFVKSENAPAVWDALAERGASPVGLGARDTLRLEAGLPLYGHELGTDPEDKEIPIFACPLAKFAASFSDLKGDFIGKAALAKQYNAFRRITFKDYSFISDLPRIIRPLAVLEKAVARQGSKVFSQDNKLIGYVTSGTMIPYWKTRGQGLESRFTDEYAIRPICLAILDSNIEDQEIVKIEVRSKKVDAMTVPYNLRSEAPPYARAIIYEAGQKTQRPPKSGDDKVLRLLDKTIENTRWRQTECINLIPSEQTQSPAVRLLSGMDPAFRYAEHKSVKAFKDTEVFYYQGTNFICEVERLLENELREYLGCKEVETRTTSGQMANTAVFSAMVDFVNHASRKIGPRRIRKVINNDIMKGGHLSAQPMGALRDYVATDPKTEKAAAVNFPVLAENPYKIDTAACGELIAEHKPELIILGKSVVLHPEPVSEIRAIVDQLDIDCVIMYDMAHVLGLAGPHFQQPFAEGADLVTGSTHKTFFGTQRGIIAGNYVSTDNKYELWEAIRRRTFPGAVSNHHLGTLLGLLMAAYEMNHFRDEYQLAVIKNAKAFAMALKDCGLNVTGDPGVGYTETHQVLVDVGYAKGPELARRLEENNIIANYQAGLGEEGFSAAGALRLGVAEMTRFGMTPDDFKSAAEFIRDVVIENKTVADKVKKFRKRFIDIQFCFSGRQYEDFVQKLHGLI